MYVLIPHFLTMSNFSTAMPRTISSPPVAGLAWGWCSAEPGADTAPGTRAKPSHARGAGPASPWGTTRGLPGAPGCTTPGTAEQALAPALWGAAPRRLPAPLSPVPEQIFPASGKSMSRALQCSGRSLVLCPHCPACGHQDPTPCAHCGETAQQHFTGPSRAWRGGSGGIAGGGAGPGCRRARVAPHQVTTAPPTLHRDPGSPEPCPAPPAAPEWHVGGLCAMGTGTQVGSVPREPSPAASAAGSQF